MKYDGFMESIDRVERLKGVVVTLTTPVCRHDVTASLPLAKYKLFAPVNSSIR